MGKCKLREKEQKIRKHRKVQKSQKQGQKMTVKRAKKQVKDNGKRQKQWYGQEKTRAKQETHQDNDVTRIKGKGKNKGISKVKTRSNSKTGVEARAQQ